MRIRTVIALATILLVPGAASAQDVVGNPKNLGRVDFGVRGTTTSGDAARYERYRDMGDGLFLEFAHLQRNEGDWKFDLTTNHLGRKDQRLVASAIRQGKIKGWFMWDQIPMLLSRTTQTFFQGDVIDNAGVLRIDDAIQAAGAASSSNIPLLFVPGNTQEFELRTRRHVAELGGQYLANADLTINALFRNTRREGAIPFGGSFGHSQLVETIAPTNHTLRDFDANAEWARGRFLFRAGYTGSWFTNDVLTLTFDNPWRITDVTSGSSRGRLSLPPSNSFVGVNGMASIRLPYRSRATAFLSTGTLKDAGDLLMPLTANTATTGVNAFPRDTVDGSASTMSANLSFTSRPKSFLDFAVRYRSYDYDNGTPELAMFQRVTYDNALSNLAEPMVTEPFSITRHNFDADARYLPMSGVSAGIGFTRLAEARTHRIFEKTVENTLRLTFDMIGNRWFTLRTRYEHGKRSGEGFEEHLLLDVSEQPGMRHMDVAPRERDRITLIGVLTPINNLAVNFSVAAGNDDYAESLFGLRDNNHRVFGVGFDATPRENVAFGVSYNRENYLALARSRQANPNSPSGCVNTFPAPVGFTTCQFFDETRNWSVDTDDVVHSVILSADFMNIMERVDVRLSWDINRSKSTYLYKPGPVADRTLPEETPDLTSTLPPPEQLPDVISNLGRGTLDFVYNFNRRFALGASYWYEKFEVEDFALDAESNVNLARSNAVLLGYLYRPYTAQTGWLRLIVRW